MKTYLKITIVISLFSLILACVDNQNEGEVEKESYKRTIITPHMEANIKEGKNLLYCSTFQLAWNELKEDIIKEDILLQNEPPMVKMLNKGLSTKEDISEKNYVAMVGFEKDGIIEKINKALKERFKDEAPLVNEHMSSDDIFAYAFLYKNLRFKEEFEDLKDPILFSSNGETAEVKGFGIKKYASKVHKDIGKQVSILDYKDDFDFIIRLTSDSPDDEIILAKLNPERTLVKTIEAIQTRIEKSKPEILEKDDVLKIPKFDFDVIRSYRELTNKPFVNKGFTEYFIIKAIQNIRFKLDQKGALLKSDAKIVMTKNGSEAKYLIFDEPFLIYLKEKNSKYPYLAIWVDNPELLVKKTEGSME